jgi:hypothetical protein
MEVVGHRLVPFVIVVRDNTGRLVGLAAFYITPYRLLNSVPYRVLRVLGDYPTGAEYLDWIIDKELEQPVANALAKALQDSGKHWDCIWMPYVSGWTGAIERIESACSNAGFVCRSRPVSFAYLPLPGSLNEFLEARSGHWRHELRRKERKVFNRNTVTFERCHREEDLPSYLDGLFDLHYRRWQLKGEEGAFRRKPNEARFYRRFAPVALRNGWLGLYALREGDAFKVAQFGYVYNGVFNGLQDGFDPDFSPGAGIVLRGKIIEASIADGLHGYDFLGEMSDHKSRWLAEERIGKHLFILRPNLKNRILLAGGVWPTGRYLRHDGRAQRLQAGTEHADSVKNEADRNGI